MQPGKTAGLLIFLFGAAVTSVFLIDFCNFVYACGCTHLWAGADSLCNIHNEQPPHCPWCSIGREGFAAVYIAILGAQLASLRLSAGFGWPLRALVVLAAFPASAGMLALLVGWWKGYWNR